MTRVDAVGSADYNSRHQTATRMPVYSWLDFSRFLDSSRKWEGVKKVDEKGTLIEPSKATTEEQTSHSGHYLNPFAK